MKPTIYIETSVIGYLTSRIRRDPITAQRQRLTRAWWKSGVANFDVFVSALVLEESRVGDITAVQERLSVLEGIPLIESGDGVDDLTDKLMSLIPLPAKAEADARHIAIAAINEMEVLLTWNLKHIANETFRDQIDNICRNNGLKPPRICTLEELGRLES